MYDLYRTKSWQYLFHEWKYELERNIKSCHLSVKVKERIAEDHQNPLACLCLNIIVGSPLLFLLTNPQMRQLVNSKWFRFRKQIDNLLHRLMPARYIPLYTMVTFSRIRYHEVIQKKRKQDKVCINVKFSYTLSHPKNDCDVTGHANGNTLQNASFVHQYRNSFLNVWVTHM